MPTVVDKETIPLIDAGTAVDFLDEEGQRGFKVKAPSSVELGRPDVKTTLASARRRFKTYPIRRNPPGKRRPDRRPASSAW